MLCFGCLVATKGVQCSGCPSWLSFITVVIQAHTSWLSEKLSCTEILLKFRMRPTAITLNYSIKNIRNNVRQIIGASLSEPHTYLYGMCVFRICILPYLCVMQYFQMLYMSKEASYVWKPERCTTHLWNSKKEERKAIKGVETNATGIVALLKVLNKGRHG